MKKLFIAGMLFAAAPFVSFAQTAEQAAVPTPVTTTPAAPGLLPTDFFYFLDRWTEVLNTALTFNKSKEARLHLEYAKERAAEIKLVLQDARAKLADIVGAKENFGKQIADAADIIKSEKEKGNDVSALAKELDDELDGSHDDLRNTLRDHEDRTSNAELEIRAKIAALSPTDPQIKGLTQALESITKEKNDSAKENDELDSDLSEERSVFEDAMGPEVAAKKHLEQTLRLREWMKERNGDPYLSSPAAELLFKKAQDALNRGDFEEAKNFSEDAKHSFEKAQEGVESELGNSDLDVRGLERSIQKSEDSLDGVER